MKTVCVTDDNPSFPIPFDRFAHSGAVNLRNPFEAIGVLHNALMATMMSKITDDIYRGVSPNGDRIFDFVARAVENAKNWELFCICVKQEGCPCTDFLTWIRGNFPPPQDGMATFPRDLFPDNRPGPEIVEKLARREFDGQHAEIFLKHYREFREILDRVRNDRCRADIFQRDVLSLEERILNGQLDPVVGQTLLISLAVARHSMYLALVSGQGVSEAPEWVGDDVDGATAGAITGSPAGPKGAVVGAAIGAGIFSLATATGWW